MITENRLRTLARQDGVTAGLAEKNFVNSWILYAIYQSQLNNQVVFKGGTALSKIYFPEIWRFSEDLDFTATDKLDDIETELRDALENIEAKSGIQFEVTNLHRAGNPTEYIQADIQYDAVLGQRNTTQLDITVDEELFFPVETHQHSFEDIPQFPLQVYSVEEIFVEKLRSLFQRARARDYYDLYRLINQNEFDKESIRDALQVKAEQQNVTIDLQTGIPQEDLDDVENYWSQALDRLVTDKPDFNTVTTQLNLYLTELQK